MNDYKKRKTELKEQKIEETKDEVVAAARRYSMKFDNGVAKEEDFFKCLREIGLAKEKRKTLK